VHDISQDACAPRAGGLDLARIRACFLPLVAAGVTALAPADACSGGLRRSPNILIISIDTLRPDHLGVYGTGTGTSPAIDRLAAEGVLFANGISTAPYTLPSHASLFTGQYPSIHGATGRPLPEETLTLAEALRSAGYETAGFHSGVFLNRFYGFSQGFGVYERHGRGFDPQSLDPKQVVSAPGVVARALRWLSNEWSGEPFFLFLHIFDPHADYLPHPPYDRYFQPEDYARLPVGPKRGPPARRGEQAPVSIEERNRLLIRYDAEIRFVDRRLQELANFLEGRGLLDETMLILVADHGEEFLDHGYGQHGRALYDETIRVPLIVRYPGLFEGGRIVADPVSLIDVFPTIAALLGLAVEEHVQGVAFQEVLAGSVVRPGVAAEHGRQVALRGRDWKMIYHLKTEVGELYSLLDDPGETVNLVREEPALYERCRRLLLEVTQDRLSPRSAEPASIDEDTQRELRSLGYVD
jgi:arylsulfatase A-like enzyme